MLDLGRFAATFREGPRFRTDRPLPRELLEAGRLAAFLAATAFDAGFFAATFFAGIDSSPYVDNLPANVSTNRQNHRRLIRSTPQCYITVRSLSTAWSHFLSNAWPRPLRAYGDGKQTSPLPARMGAAESVRSAITVSQAVCSGRTAEVTGKRLNANRGYKDPHQRGSYDDGDSSSNSQRYRVADHEVVPEAAKADDDVHDAPSVGVRSSVAAHSRLKYLTNAHAISA